MKAKKVKAGTFQGLGLCPQLFKAIKQMGYRQPTPIQRKAIPRILDGVDVVAMARTGSGKSAAFLIPTIEKLKEHSKIVGVRAVCLAPTRELTMQTAKFARSLGKFTDLRVCILVGGKSMEKQFDRLAQNPDIIVCTPGRLMHHMIEVDLKLTRVQMLVFDEADRLFELGFAEQLHKVITACPPSRQALLFSATMPSQLVAFTRVGLRDPEFVRLDVEITLSEQLSLWKVLVTKEQKISALLYVLGQVAKPKTSTIVFFATRHHIEFFNLLLKEFGIACAVVYGNMEQEQRSREIQSFRKHKVPVMLVTDVAARGIDIPLLDCVVNYDFPASSKLFVHRAGRTARAGKSGLAISLMTLDDMPYCLDLMLFLGRKLLMPGEEDTLRPNMDPKIADLEYVPFGGLPSTLEETEFVSQQMAGNSELRRYFRSMDAAYGLYYKTRQAASKASCRRSKQLLEEAGGAASIRAHVHAGFRSADYKGEQERQDYLAHMRSFRPDSAKKGAALSSSTFSAMEKTRNVVNLMKDMVKASAQAQADQEAADSASDTEEDKGDAEPGSKRPASEVAGKPRVSKRARKQGVALAAPKKGPKPKKAAKRGKAESDDEGGIEITVDGKTAFGKKSKERQEEETERGSVFDSDRFRDKGFFLSMERTGPDAESAKERGLQMDTLQFDIMPDDETGIKTTKSVIKWDARRKKFLPVLIAADGKVVKQKMRKNEAGILVKGDKEKTDSYRRWTRASKTRVQQVGEVEHTYAADPRAARRQAETRTIEFEDDGDHQPEPGKNRGDQDGKKPIVPFKGTIPDAFLTARQKRLIARREHRGKLESKGEVKQEVRTPEQIAKHKKQKRLTAIKQNPKLRNQAHKEKKRIVKHRLDIKVATRNAPAYQKTKTLVINKHAKGKVRNSKNRGY